MKRTLDALNLDGWPESFEAIRLDLPLSLGITLIYQRAVYGAGNVTEADYGYVRDYYQAFFKNAHARMGHPRWVLRGFWRI